MSVELVSAAASSSTSRRRYLQAGGVYFVLGSTVMAITVMTPGLASPERRADLVHLLIGLPFFALFAALIAFGDRLFAAPMRWLGAAPEQAATRGAWVREKLTMLLTLSALGRTFIFTSNGFGWKPGIDWQSLAFSFEAVSPMPRMLVNALLMVVILALFIRAAWIPFLERTRSSASKH